MRLPQEPNRPTCPDINRIQRTIDEIIKDFNSFKTTDTADDFMNSMSNTVYELKGIYDELEDLRSWGQELLDIAENTINERDIFESELDEARNTISDLQSILNDYDD